MKRIAETYKRWRHSRGYGVHSPYAYRLVKEVFHPGSDYAWYGYSKIDRGLRSGKQPYTRKEARTLLRLASFLHPRSAYIPIASHKAGMREVLHAADSRMKIRCAEKESKDCELVLSDGEALPLETIIEIVTRPERVLCIRNLPAGWKDRLIDALPEGVIFHSPTDAVLIHRPSTAKVCYSINF